MSVIVQKADKAHRKDGLAREITPLFIRGVPWKGKPTNVFGYLGEPGGGGKKPAILLVHGGDGRAYDEWVHMWTQKGFVALAPDLNAQMYGQEGDCTPNSDGGPKGYGSFCDDCADTENTWSGYCVRLLVACAEYLRNRPDVDVGKLFAHGISWGGYLTYLLLGTYKRFALAGVSYTTAYLYRDPYWTERGLNEEAMGANYGRWVQTLDPQRYIGNITTPVIWARGINDAAFSSDLVNDTLDLFAADTVTPVFYREYAHNQEDGCRIPEIVAAIERAANGTASADGACTYSVVYTCDTCKDARDRVWHEREIAAEDYLQCREKEWAAWYYNRRNGDGLVTSARIVYHED